MLFVAFLLGSFMDLIDGRLCNWVTKIIDQLLGFQKIIIFR